MVRDEYLRRNLLVAKVIGARGAALSALLRLQQTKNPPRWVIKKFEDIETRLDGLDKDLAAYRDEMKLDG